jgi:hypothetical protein
MYAGLFYYIGKGEAKHAPVFDFSKQITSIGTVFGNTVFIFIYHHSISGIIYPIRPQSSLKKMFMISHIVGYTLLSILGLLAFFTFSGYDNECTTYPCKVQPLFNENFMGIPGIG